MLIVASNSLPASYFRKVRQELGGGPAMVIDALVWSPPREPVDDVVRRYELIGPEEESGPDSVPSTDARTEPPRKPAITGLARIRAGVKRRDLARRYPDRSVVFGLPAAAVHLKGGIPGWRAPAPAITSKPGSVP